MGDKQFKDLPNEVIMVIFTFMDFIEIINCTKVSKRIRKISQNETLWKKVNLHKHPNLSSEFLKIVIENGCKYLNLKMANICGNLSLDKPTKLKYLDISGTNPNPHKIKSCNKYAEVLIQVIYFCLAEKKCTTNKNSWCVLMLMEKKSLNLLEFFRVFYILKDLKLGGLYSEGRQWSVTLGLFSKCQFGNI